MLAATAGLSFTNHRQVAIMGIGCQTTSGPILRLEGSPMFLIQFAVFAALGVSTPEEQVVDIGSPGDEAFVGEGFYGREGPVPKSKMSVAARNNFRWARDRFTLRLTSASRSTATRPASPRSG